MAGIFDSFNISGMAASTGNIVVIILSIVVPVAIIGGIMWWWTEKKTKYNQFICVVLHRDGTGNIHQSYDKAGIFVDKKTNNKLFFMKNNNVGLSPDNVPYIPGAGGKKLVYLLQYGLKNFAFINVRIKDNTNEIQLQTSEEDVSWAVNSYERQKKLFTQGLFMQLLPFLVIGFVSIIILVIFVYFFKNFAVLKDLGAALQSTAEALKEAAKELAASRMATPSIPHP
jgi:hypothetical protein